MADSRRILAKSKSLARGSSADLGVHDCGLEEEAIRTY